MRKGLESVLGKPERQKCCSPLLCSLIPQHRESPQCLAGPVCRWMGPHPPTVLQHPPYKPALLPIAGGLRWQEHAVSRGSAAGRCPSLPGYTGCCSTSRCGRKRPRLLQQQGKSPRQRSSVSAETLISAICSQELGAEWRPGPWQWWCINRTRNSPPHAACLSLPSRQQSLLYF